MRQLLKKIMKYFDSEKLVRLKSSVKVHNSDYCGAHELR